MISTSFVISDKLSMIKFCNTVNDDKLRLKLSVIEDIPNNHCLTCSLPECQGVDRQVFSTECWHWEGVGSLIALPLHPSPLHGASVEVASIIPTLQHKRVYQHSECTSVTSSHTDHGHPELSAVLAAVEGTQDGAWAFRELHLLDFSPTLFLLHLLLLFLLLFGHIVLSKLLPPSLLCCLLLFSLPLKLCSTTSLLLLSLQQ